MTEPRFEADLDLVITPPEGTESPHLADCGGGALTPASWLVDESVLARVDVAAVADAVLPRVQVGQVGVALVTELEVGCSARGGQDYGATRQDLLDLLIPVTRSVRAEERARELQRDLVTRGSIAE